jgi:hypothetical protein
MDEVLSRLERYSRTQDWFRRFGMVRDESLPQFKEALRAGKTSRLLRSIL